MVDGDELAKVGVALDLHAVVQLEAGQAQGLEVIGLPDAGGP